ncbi:MAG: (2Fe-2S)-binding protein [Acetobacteraceae bacterium]|nr:(2Fe-2S)-binding protein [Acetobacteraceae bacterium]MBV8522237.1 (2Fe-2S)-binding protein [Acetobacteraceae bacterium]MBV8592569.1 (2Fe-2S)-binding protein [Acetobacteraceae bacterium]
MSDARISLTVDGTQIQALEGQSVIQACDAAGVYVPRLCYHPDLPPAGHCRVCSCRINGRINSACVTPVSQGMVVENDTPALNSDRRVIIEMLFVEGYHLCPTCEKSGDCELQALGYRLGMAAPTLPYLWPQRELDATHPEIVLDRNRCILCSRCIRASRYEDGKSVFGFEGRGIHMRLTVDGSALGDTAMAAADKAAHVCPVGCILIKRTGFRTPSGHHRFDKAPIGSDIEAVRSVPKT